MRKLILGASIILVIVLSLTTFGEMSLGKTDENDGSVRMLEKEGTDSSNKKEFRLWATGCAHVHTDKIHNRLSMTDAITDSEEGGDEGGQSFDWDIMLHLGDLKGEQGTPDDEDGKEVLKQFSSSKKHPREDIYNLLGNHDASGPDEPQQWWFKKWIDPTGEHPEISGVHAERRPYPVTGTWERYYFEVGNVLFLMMGDRNDGGPPAGRQSKGGYPAGRVSEETFEWWKNMVESNQDKIIISAHHHMLENTTVASGLNEGIEADYHGNFKDGAPEGASFIYFVGDTPHAQKFETYLEEHPGAIDIWLGGHTHTNPDDTYGGRSHIERKWDVTFINVSALSKYHGRKNIPMSRLLTFVDDNDTVNVECYLHTSHYAPEGWYDKAERAIQLNKFFKAP